MLQMVNVIIKIRRAYDRKVCIISFRNAAGNDGHLQSAGTDKFCHSALFSQNTVWINGHMVTAIGCFFKFFTKILHSKILRVIFILVKSYSDLGHFLLCLSTAGR